MTEVLSARALNRATLARQHLLARAPLGTADAVGHLVALQGQAVPPPYTALWARVEGFAGADLSALIESRDVVRMTLNRGTIHVALAGDAAVLRPLTEPSQRQSTGRVYAEHLAGVDTGELAAIVRELVERSPSTPAEIVAALQERWPGRLPQALTNAAGAWVPLVQVPPRGLWRRGGQVRLTTFEHWTGRTLAGDPSLEDVVLRFLAAHGPATPHDVKKWLGRAHLGPVVEALRPRLATFRDEAGTELVDLPDAPRPGPDADAPVRLLPEFDAPLLAYAGFDRVMDPALKRTLFTVNGRVLATVLVDGYVAGTWRVEAAKGVATLTVTPLTTITARDRRAVEAEGERLLAFLEPDAGHAIVMP